MRRDEEEQTTIFSSGSRVLPRSLAAWNDKMNVFQFVATPENASFFYRPRGGLLALVMRLQEPTPWAKQD